MIQNLLVGAHPDDIDVMLGYAIEPQSTVTLVASDGESGMDITSSCLCRH